MLCFLNPMLKSTQDIQLSSGWVRIAAQNKRTKNASFCVHGRVTAGNLSGIKPKLGIDYGTTEEGEILYILPVTCSHSFTIHYPFLILWLIPFPSLNMTDEVNMGNLKSKKKTGVCNGNNLNRPRK